MRVPLKNITRRVPDRADGYYEDVLAHGEVIGDELELSQEAFAALAAKYKAMPVPRLSLTEKLANFAAATARWVRHGFPVVTADELAARGAECMACEYWVSDACSICGCREMKHEWSTEACPIGKWRALDGASKGALKGGES